MTSSKLEVVKLRPFPGNKSICRYTCSTLFIRYGILRTLSTQSPSTLCNLHTATLHTPRFLSVRLMSQLTTIAYGSMAATESTFRALQAGSSATILRPIYSDILYHNISEGFVFFQSPRNVMLTTSTGFYSNFESSRSGRQFNTSEEIYTIWSGTECSVTVDKDFEEFVFLEIFRSKSHVEESFWVV